MTRTLPLEVYLQREQDPDAAEQPTAPVEVTRVSHPPVGFSLRADVPERGVDYELTGRPGETIALIGPNGSGKSTGVRLLAGDITSPQSRLDRPSAVGFLDQSPSLFAHMSVLDNVAFGPRCAGMAKDAARERALAELAGVGLAGLAERSPREISGGRAQRVALARVLAVDPQLLLLDEPFAALDRAAAVAELGVDVGTVLFAEVKAVQVRLIPTPNHSATGN